jgi:hypothetical protein
MLCSRGFSTTVPRSSVGNGWRLHAADRRKRASLDMGVAEFANRPALLGTGFLAYTFGLRHAVDAERTALTRCR